MIDVSDPSNMRDVALFDTFSIPIENSPNFNGAWGVYPFLPSGNILISDIEYGLFVVKLNENDGAFPAASGGGGNGASSGNVVGGSSSGGGSFCVLALFLLILLARARSISE